MFIPLSGSIQTFLRLHCISGCSGGFDGISRLWFIRFKVTELVQRVPRCSARLLNVEVVVFKKNRLIGVVQAGGDE